MIQRATREKPRTAAVRAVHPIDVGLGGVALIGLALILLAIIPFLQAANFVFLTFDDVMYVTNQPVVQGGLTWYAVKWAFTTMNACNWHPLTWIAHCLDCELFGLSPGAHHLVNVALHALNTVLLWRVLWRMTDAIWRSALVAALFAVHPLHVESVAWVSERKDLLSTAFGLIGILFYVRYAQGGGFRSYGGLIIGYALSLLCKPMLVTLPFVLLLLDWWPLRRFRIGHDEKPVGAVNPPSVAWLFLEKIPLLVMAAASCIVTVIAQSRGAAMQTLDEVSFQSRVANTVASYAMYLLQTVWPAKMAVYYPHVSHGTGWVAGCSTALLAITALAVWQVKSRPWLIVGWLLYLGMLVPVIGLVQVGSQARADRYTYLPLIGIFIMVAWSLPIPRTSSIRQSLIAGSGAVLASLLIITWIQASYWRNSVALFEHALAVTPDNYVVRCNLGNSYLEAQRPEEAVQQLLLSEQMKSDSPITEYNLGIALHVAGRTVEAIDHFRRAVDMVPSYAIARANLGGALVAAGRLEEAVKECQTALQTDPNLPEGHAELGLALAAAGYTDAAIEHLRQAIALKPSSNRTRVNLAVCLAGQGRTDEAIQVLVIALAQEPTLVEAHTAIAGMLAKTGNLPLAIEHLQYAVMLRPNDERIRQKLTQLMQQLQQQGATVGPDQPALRR